MREAFTERRRNVAGADICSGGTGCIYLCRCTLYIYVYIYAEMVYYECIASSSNLLFYLYWYSYIIYFVCDSASEFGAMGSTFFWRFSCPNLLLVCLNLLFLGTCIIFFLASVGILSVCVCVCFFSVPYFGLACDHGNSFLCLEE